MTSLASLASVAQGPISIAGHLQEAPRINIISIQHPVVAHYHLNKRSTFARVMLAVLFAGCLFLSSEHPSIGHMVKHLFDITQPDKVTPED